MTATPTLTLTRPGAVIIADNVVLALGRAVLAVGIAYAGVGMLTGITARVSPRSDEIAVDGWVLLFTLALSLLVALFLSFVPKIGDEDALAQGLQEGRKGCHRPAPGSRHHHSGEVGIQVECIAR